MDRLSSGSPHLDSGPPLLSPIHSQSPPEIGAQTEASRATAPQAQDSNQDFTLICLMYFFLYFKERLTLS